MSTGNSSGVMGAFVVDDAAIIRQVLSGNHQQFSILVRRYQEPLTHFLRGILKNDQEALDCAQEAFISAYQNLWRYSDQYTFRAWLYRIAHNKAIDLLRKRRREVPLTSEDYLITPCAGPEEEWLTREEAASIRNALDSLPEHYRQVLYLRYHQDLAYEEIAQALDIPLSRVKTHIHRGKAKLKQELERRAGQDERQNVNRIIPGSSH